jgi:hypothetical protein
MSQVDPKILELEKTVKFLEEQVGRLLTQVQYLDRERIRAKNEISQVMNEVRARRN